MTPPRLSNRTQDPDTASRPSVGGPTASDADAAAVLLHMRVAREPHVYVLGSYESRVTIYSQQIRAFNLAYALASIGELGPNSRVAVVGGGVAGLTFAAAASSLESSVVLFERRPELLHVMRGCHTRYVHPNIYDWPTSNRPLEKGTDLPFMNWEAGTANEVADQLLAQFEPIKRRVDVRLGATVLIREANAGSRRVTVTSRHEELDFSAIVLALGFGVETTIHPQALRSYWRDDSLHQPELQERIGGRTRYLVSGNGDGGLIDLLRLRLEGFRHETLFEEISRSADLKDVEKNLTQVEHEARSEMLGHRSPDRALHESYLNLQGVPPALDEHIAQRLRKDTHVVFNYPNWPLSLRASILHRLLVSRLLSLDSELEPLPGRLVAVEGHEPTLRCAFDTDSGTLTRSFHRAVIRHGPRCEIAESYPLLHARFEPELSARNALDATRSPIWPPGFFAAFAPTPSFDAAGTAIDAGADANSETSQPSNDPTTTGSKPTNGEISASDAPKHVGDDVRELREALAIGEVSGLESKIALLTEDQRHVLVRSLTARALASDDALRGFRRLSSSNALDKEMVRGSTTEILRRAAFTSSITRKVRTLELPPETLSLGDGSVLQAFFDDVFDIIELDKFDEVNALVPALVSAQSAIPVDRHARYFRTLLGQSGSSSYQGAPTARRALATLPESIAKTAMAEVNSKLLASSWTADALRTFLQSHYILVPSEVAPLVQDFLALPHSDFRVKHGLFD